MEYIIGIILYVAVVAAFSAFGKFLKECDEGIKDLRHPERTFASLLPDRIPVHSP